MVLTSSHGTGGVPAREMKHRRAENDPAAGCELVHDFAPAGHVRGHRTGLRVLLIEDNEDQVILVRRALEARGHTVASVLEGRAAMAVLAEERFDAVALDYQLPDTTGLDMLQQIRQRDQTLPVVMVTGWGSEQVAVEALTKGARDYVVKTPGYERELVRALELAAAKARAEAAEALLRAELTRLATTDCLTGLLNRGEMERLLKREIEGEGRRRRVFSFALGDADLLKVINDTEGHSAGDAVLRHIASMLRRSSRSSDSVARWGGDEFAVLLPGTGFGGAEAFADRLLVLVSELPPVVSGKTATPITLSVGAACVRGSVSDPALVLKWADRALYAAKTGGRNQTRITIVGNGRVIRARSRQSPGRAFLEGGELDGKG